MRHDFAGFAGNRAVASFNTGLIGTHGKAIVHGTGDLDQIAIAGQTANGLAVRSSLDDIPLSKRLDFLVGAQTGLQLVKVTVSTIMSFGGLGRE